MKPFSFCKNYFQLFQVKCVAFIAALAHQVTMLISLSGLVQHGLRNTSSIEGLVCIWVVDYLEISNHAYKESSR